MQIVNRLKRLFLCGAPLRLSLLLISCAIFTVGKAQEPRVVPTVSNETYRQVLDIVFPRNQKDFRDPNKKFAMNLRFKPAFDAESQINITEFYDGRLDIVVYTLPKGSQNISNQLNQMLQQTGQEDVVSMARGIKTMRQSIVATAKLQKMHRLLRRYAALRFTPQLDTAITLDGIEFQLWFAAVSSESYYSLVGSDSAQNLRNHPLVRWMNEVRQVAFN